MFTQLLITALVCFGAPSKAAPASAPAVAPDFKSDEGLIERQALSPYAPISTSCPNTPLVRPADSLSSGESTYVSARNALANSALSSWLQSRGSFSISSLPVVGFTSSGGGYRSLLTTAGVVQAFDIRDSSTGVSGVYQGLTYQAGISGGSWFLSSLAANNWYVNCG